MNHRTSKLIVHVLFILMLFAGVTSAAAAPANDHQVVTSMVSFKIAADQCPKLPAGVAIVDASGESVTISDTHTLPDGSTVVESNNVIKGTATDNNNVVHKFVYQNFSTDTALVSGEHTISMTDTFVLTGPGPNYSVGFYWRWTYDPTLDPPESFWPPAQNLQTIRGTEDDVYACDPL